MRLLTEDQLIAELNSELRRDEAFREGMAFVPYPHGTKARDMSGYSTTGPFELTGVYARVAQKVFAHAKLRTGG
jgi:hypothetical protein